MAHEQGHVVTADEVRANWNKVKDILSRLRTGEISEDMARAALADSLNITSNDPRISEYITNASFTNPDGTPTATPDAVFGGGDPGGGFIREDGFFNMPQATAADDFYSTGEGMQASFTDYIRGLNPGGSRWLQRGIQRQLDPLKSAFLAESALGTTPMRVEGQWGQTGTPINFRQYLSGTGGGIPTDDKWQNILAGVSNWLTSGDRGIAGTTSKMEDYATDENNQFNLAFNSIAQSIPYHLRASARQAAARSFDEFRSRNAARMDEWLPAWREQGQNWNPTLGPQS